MNQKAFTLIELIAVVALLALIALVVFPSINSVVKSSKEKAYESQKNEIVKAGKEYFIDNTDALPAMSENSSNSVSLSTLVSEGYISEDDIKDPRDTSKKMSGYVKAIYTSNQYVYEYSTSDDSVLPGEQLLNKKTSSISILKANNKVYKGSDPDNYIKFGGKVFRIIKINNDNSLKIISDTSITLAFDSNGSSSFSDSSLNSYLNNTYYNSLTNKSGILKSSFCTGDLSDECSSKVSSYVGLMKVSDYVKASSASDCINTNSLCKNGNYLNKNIKEFTLTNSGSGVYIINGGNIEVGSTASSMSVRPVINITSKITGGEGTSSNPYKTD